MSNQFPKIHNAMWPGLVGKGSPGAEPFLDLDTMLDLTSRAEVNGVKFDGVDLFLFDPHISIDSSSDDLKRVADKIRQKGFVVGSVVAPVWPPTGGGSAMGDADERKKFVEAVRKGCRIASVLRELGVRPYGVVRIDSASGASDWAKDPTGNQQRIAETFREACDVAAGFGERLAAEGEICWGGMHSWRRMVQLLELVDRPQTLGFQADMAHTLLYTMGYNAPEDAILPQNFDWKDGAKLDDALKTLTAALRPWTIDFHVAQNDATVKGSGSHDKTGRHCLATDPNGKLNIPHHAGYWLRDEKGRLTRAFRHICWDGCMFPNETLMKPETWNDILGAMIAVREAHGWSEPSQAPVPPPKLDPPPVRVSSKASPRRAPAARSKAPAPQARPATTREKAPKRGGKPAPTVKKANAKVKVKATAKVKARPQAAAIQAKAKTKVKAGGKPKALKTGPVKKSAAKTKKPAPKARTAARAVPKKASRKPARKKP